jgi:hypothetical protein
MNIYLFIYIYIYILHVYITLFLLYYFYLIKKNAFFIGAVYRSFFTGIFTLMFMFFFCFE